MSIISAYVRTVCEKQIRYSTISAEEIGRKIINVRLECEVIIVFFFIEYPTNADRQFCKVQVKPNFRTNPNQDEIKSSQREYTKTCVRILNVRYI